MDNIERYSSDEEKIRTAFDSMAAGLWTAAPAIIQKFNAVNMTLTAECAIKGNQRDEQGNFTPINIKLLVDCPVCFTGGGGATLTFPITQGDECLIVFASRCIDAWWQSGGVQPPIELRMHDLSDGFAIVGVRSRPRVLSSISTTSTQLRSDDGETYIDFASGKIQIVADEVVIHGRNKTTFDAGGTGFIYTPATIDTYTDGVPSNHHSPNPPEVPT